jgi:predicted hotdog family 3-hydroxylacyl-ACP dehydratase
MSLAELKDWPVSKLVPHAPPMLLIDRVVSVSDEAFEAEVRIRHESLFCDGTKVNAWVGIEYMAQAVAAYAGAEAVAAGRSIKTGFLLGTRSYVCRAPSFEVGATIRILVRKVLIDPGGLNVLECTLRDHDKQEALVTANLTVYEVADLPAYIKVHVK